MRRKKSFRWTCPAAVGFIIAAPLKAAMHHTVTGYVLTAAALLFFVKVMPFCRKRENLWVFFLTAVCSVPINISLTLCYIWSRRLPWRLLVPSVAYLLLFTLEELIMGYVTRRIWGRQYRLSSVSDRWKT